MHIYDERGHHVLGPERKYERHDVVLHRPQTLIPSSRGTTSSGTDRVSSGTTWCFTVRNDVLPVNRTMKKYKICVTIILNFLIVIF